MPFRDIPLRVAAISFLNPAPLLYNFEHEPAAASLRGLYQVHYTTPAGCAAELHAEEADLGLVPIAQLTSDLKVVPGCAIASLKEVRSILLLVRNPHRLPEQDALCKLNRIAADAASRSSAAYVRTLLRTFYGADPVLNEHPADPEAMLRGNDAALLIGDPALLARERRPALDASFSHSLLWIDLASLWHRHTGLPWVAAVWAVRPKALQASSVTPRTLVHDLTASRDAGLAHVEDLVREWTPRLALRPEAIREYLTRNIHYDLDTACLEAIRLFRSMAAAAGVLPRLDILPMLTV